MDEDPQVEASEPLDPVQVLHDAIAQVAEGGAYCAGFVLGVEWLEEDGSRSLQVFHSPMPPWHLTGLLEYMKDESHPPLVAMAYGLDDDDDWDDGEDF